MVDGKPLAGVGIKTEPIESTTDTGPDSGSVGITDSVGQYTLSQVDPSAPGAKIGQHRVIITRPGPRVERFTGKPIKQLGSPWPARYSDGSLRLTVPPEGTSEANFEIILK